MTRLFNAYVMVDWSAATTPKLGRDSVWIGVLKRDIRFRPTFEAFNPHTRHAAEHQLREVMADLRRRGDRALIGFDFALGYPAGTSAMLKTKAAGWQGLWSFLAANVVDKADNTNNRFAVAAKMNRLMTDQPWPFWGAPAKDAQRWLTTTKPSPPADFPLPTLRQTERATQGLGRAGAKSVWQLMGAGADVHDREALVAEVYPALVPASPEPGEIVDRAQVRALCEHFARLDEQGKLGAAFAPPKGAAPELVETVEGEEGWILGAGAPAAVA